MKVLKLFFKSATGERLAARLDLPADEKTSAYALFAHCFTCNKNYKALAHIGRALTQEGIAVLRFDFTGLGESEGDFADTSFSSNVADLIAAADFLSEEFEAPKILIGHSLGGSAVLQAAAQVPSCVAVVTIAAPGEPSHVLRLLGGTKESIEARGEAEITIAGRKFTVRKQFLDDLEQARMQQTIGDLNRALLVVHSRDDRTVGIENAEHIFRAARHPKGFFSLDQADHLLSSSADSLYVGSLIAAWSRRFVGVSEAGR
jgi:putative redox protein